MGALGLNVDPKYGGLGLDAMYNMIWCEQLCFHNVGGSASGIVNHLQLPVQYLAKFGSEELKQKYLVPSVSGDAIGSLGMTEPNAGSDLAAIRTTAVRKGDHYIVNGSKTFITNGIMADYMVTAVKIDGQVSMLVIDTKSEGYSFTKLDKLGIRASDTAEIALDNVKVPVENLLGEEGKGFYYMMRNLQIERLGIAWGGMGSCMGIMDITIKYIHEREAFGRPIANFQVIRHKLVDLQTEIDATRAFTYLTTQRFANNEDVTREASMLKLKAGELSKQVADECLQFFGGYGYMEEYPIARIYRDNRISAIYAGTSEIMKEILAKIIIDGKKYKPTVTK
jgi:alkylation response protein AidB-like acyl-CoA dehydrogenase